MSSRIREAETAVQDQVFQLYGLDESEIRIIRSSGVPRDPLAVLSQGGATQGALSEEQDETADRSEAGLP